MKKLSDAVGRNFLIFDFLIDVRIIKTPAQNYLTSTSNHYQYLNRRDRNPVSKSLVASILYVNFV